MSQPDDLTADLVIERTTDLDLDVERMWELISTAEGWSSWLVDDADVIIAADETGTATSDGVERGVHIDQVTEGRGVAFSWWDRDDPSTASYVQIGVVELPDGRSQLRVTERFLGATSNATTASSQAIAWEVRFASLWLLALHSTVLA
ncbi:MAG: hypothetical protein ABI894_17795 [Ilumatobacteraceae bacterium]